MPIGTSIIGALNIFIAACKFNNDLKRARVQNLSPAIVALSAAIHETEIYFRDRNEGKVRDTAREDSLSRLWNAAAEPVRLVNPELSDLCAHKAKYWLFPTRYTRDEVKQLQITLEGMNASLQALRLDGV